MARRLSIQGILSLHHQLSRSPVKVTQSFNFSVVTTLVNISARFSALRIFVKDKAHSLTILGYSDILSLCASFDHETLDSLRDE
ncbi:hypothetical protein Tco_0386710 [Tanacetum coccineum]